MKTTSPCTTRRKGVSNDKWFRQFDVNAVHSSLCYNHSHGNHWNNCYFTNTSVLWVMVAIFKIKSRDSWGIMHLVPSRKRWQLDQEAEDIIFIISALAGRIAVPIEYYLLMNRIVAAPVNWYPIDYHWFFNMLGKTTSVEKICSSCFRQSAQSIM